MPRHRFTVNIPNATDAAAAVRLELKPARISDLGRPLIDAPRTNGRVTHAGISRDPCDEGQPTLNLRLRPRESADVYVTAVTAAPRNPAVGATAAINLIDRRGKSVGGVFLVCIDGGPGDTPGTVVDVRGKCPATLTDLFGSGHPADPTKQTTHTLQPDTDLILVAAIHNPTASPLADTTVYLEHTGLSGMTFEPKTWYVGALRPSDVFFATWHVSTVNARSGSFEASVVAQSKGKAPVRLQRTLKVGPRRKGDQAETSGNRARAAKRRR